MQIEKLSSYMCPAGSFDDGARLIQPVESRITVRLQDAVIVLQVARRMFAFAIRRVSWGGGCPPTPATPPCVRVRTRRFEKLRRYSSISEGRPRDLK